MLPFQDIGKYVDASLNGISTEYTFRVEVGLSQQLTSRVNGRTIQAAYSRRGMGEKDSRIRAFVQAPVTRNDGASSFEEDSISLILVNDLRNMC